MRKHTTYSVFVALLLTVAFSSCRREPLPENAILFSVGPEVNVEAATKAGSPADQGYNEIKLYGSTASFTVFDGTLLTKNSTFGVWEYSPLKYWEQGQTYNFRAVYPAVADIQSGASSTSVEVLYNSLGVNTDSKYYGNYDLMVATAPSKQTQTTKVPLQFHHACAAVGFVFTKSGNESADCKITSLTLKNVYTSGTLTYKSTTEDATVPNSDWTLPGSTTGTWTLSSAEWAVPTAVQWYFVVPQSLSGASLEYTYTFGTDAAKTVPLSLPAATWEPGKAYKYTIDIGISTITAEVAEWTSFTGSVTDIVFGEN